MNFKGSKNVDKSEGFGLNDQRGKITGLAANLPIILENFNDKCDNSFDNFKSLDISKFSINSNDFSFEYSKKVQSQHKKGSHNCIPKNSSYKGINDYKSASRRRQGDIRKQ